MTHPLLRRCRDCRKIISLKPFLSYEVAYSEDDRGLYCRACTERQEKESA